MNNEMIITTSREASSYKHHLLSGKDMYTKTPYQRGFFLARWRYVYTPTKHDLEVFRECGEFDRAMIEFAEGVHDAKSGVEESGS
jgi:hypothetical protein